MTGNERKEPRSTSRMILSPRARIGRYREQAARFTRLAEGEQDATFRDRWKNLARECAFSASGLENERAARRNGRARPSSLAGKNALKISQGGG